MAVRHARAEHYWRNKRSIAGGILVANLGDAVTSVIHPPVLDFSYLFGVLIDWPMLLILPFSR